MSTYYAGVETVLKLATSNQAKSRLLAWSLQGFHQEYRQNADEALAKAWSAYAALTALDQEGVLSTVQLYLAGARNRGSLVSGRANVALALMLICGVGVQLTLPAMWSIPIYALGVSYLATRWVSFRYRAKAYAALLAHLEGCQAGITAPAYTQPIRDTANA